MGRNSFYILNCGFTFSTLNFKFSPYSYALVTWPLTSTKDYVRKNILFMQNKANFKKVKLNVTKVLTKNYVQMDTWSIGKNEPKRTQNEPKFKKAKMNITSILTVDYENISNWAICENEPNTKPNKPNACPPSVWQACPLSVWRVRGKKMCLDASIILTFTNMVANFKKCMVFWLFIERTLFGR